MTEGHLIALAVALTIVGGFILADEAKVVEENKIKCNQENAHYIENSTGTDQCVKDGKILWTY